jgi:hypothetical protein
MISIFQKPFKKRDVPLEKSSFKLAAAEDFLEECFNRRRATERRCNIRTTTRPI